MSARLAGMADWPCELRAGRGDRPIDAGNAHLLKHEGGGAPCGTFQVGEGVGGRYGIITYNPGMAGDPAGLAATFAHEFGHYLMATAAAPPPGGWDLHELHTDLAAVYLGFGIFMANSAKQFSHFSTESGAGWRSLAARLSERACAGHRDRDLPAPRRPRPGRGRALPQALSARDPQEGRPRAREAGAGHGGRGRGGSDL